MILDKETMMSEDQAVTATAASTNVIDLGLGDIGLSQDQAPYLYVKVGTAFNNLTSLTIALQTATDAAFTTPITVLSNVVALAALTLNSEQIRAQVPAGCKRYVRMYYTVTGTAPTTGKITAGLVQNFQGSF